MRRWTGNTNIEHDDAILFWIIGHGISAIDRLFDVGSKLPDQPSVPIPAILFFNIEILVVDDVFWAFDLDVPA